MNESDLPLKMDRYASVEDAIYAEELDLDLDADEIRRLKAATLGRLERDGKDGVGR